MALYLMWNAYSMFAPHEYSAIDPLTGEAYSVPRFIMIGTVIPFVMYVVGRYTFDRTAAVRVLLWTILALAAYSAAVSILQFTGPTAWVWPRFIVDGSLAPDETWVGRAVGVFNQPVVNGMILALGFAVAMLLMSRHSEPAWRRCLAFVIAVACGYRHLSDPHPGSLAQRRGRAHHRCTAGKGATARGSSRPWASPRRSSRSTGRCSPAADREAGGVGSVSEVDDRLNTDPDSALGGRTETPRRLGHRPVPMPSTPTTISSGPRKHHGSVAMAIVLAHKRAGDSGRVGR